MLRKETREVNDRIGLLPSICSQWLLLSAIAIYAVLVAPDLVQAGTSCERPNSETLASSSQARVFAVGPEEKRRVLGCLYRTNKRYALLAPATVREDKAVISTEIDNVELVGTRLAFSWSSTELDTGSGGVLVLNLANGRTTKRRPALTVGGEAPFSRVTQIKLSSKGSIAWIAEASAGGSGKYLRQVAADDLSGFRLLDESREIDPTSLRLGDGDLTWLNAGTRRTAPFR